MYQKKDYVFSETMGICVVADITNLSTDKSNPVQYYVLKSIKDKKVSYIPVENHKVVLRDLTEEEKALI